jgi:hypothetical protein
MNTEENSEEIPLFFAIVSPDLMSGKEDSIQNRLGGL